MALNSLQLMIAEQFQEYSETLKELEKEIIRKYKAGEDYSADVTRAAGLKILKEQCVKMMVEKR
jgi:hypothetical protein